MRDQQSSDTSIALGANTDVQHRHDDPQLQSRVPPTAIVIALCAGASVLTIKRIK